jgi:hypothetical protein
MDSFDIIFEYSVSERLLRFLNSRDLYCFLLVNKSYCRHFLPLWRRLIKWQRYDSIFGYQNLIENKPNFNISDIILDIDRDNESDFNFIFIIDCHSSLQLDLVIRSLQHSRSFTFDAAGSYLSMIFLTVPTSDFESYEDLRHRSHFYFCIIELTKSTILIEYSNLFNVQYLIFNSYVSHCDALSCFFKKFHHINFAHRRDLQLNLISSRPYPNYTHFLAATSNNFRYSLIICDKLPIIEQYQNAKIVVMCFYLENMELIYNGCFGILKDRFLINLSSKDLIVSEIMVNSYCFLPHIRYKSNYDLFSVQLLSCGMLICIQEIQDQNILTIFDIVVKQIAQIPLTKDAVDYDRNYVSWTVNVKNTLLYCLNKKQEIEYFKLNFTSIN